MSTDEQTNVHVGQRWEQHGDRAPLDVLGRVGNAQDDRWRVITEGETFTLTGDEIRLGYRLAHATGNEPESRPRRLD